MNTSPEGEDTVALELNEDEFPTSRDVYQANDWGHTQVRATCLEHEDTVALGVNEDGFTTSQYVYQANEWVHALDALGFT